MQENSLAFSFVAIIAAVLCNPHGLEAQTTNFCPTNLFLTDDSKVFWYNSQHQRTISVAKIREAQKAPESRPAQEDPEGQWGSATNGFQLGLRFEKQVYQVGEPVMATVFLRNVSSETLRYIGGFGYWPIPVATLAFSNGTLMEVKAQKNGFRGSVREVTLFPQSQHRYQVDLNGLYDLKPGLYAFEARCDQPMLGGAGKLEITSQRVSITITDKPPSGSR